MQNACNMFFEETDNSCTKPVPPTCPPTRQDQNTLHRDNGGKWGLSNGSEMLLFVDTLKLQVQNINTIKYCLDSFWVFGTPRGKPHKTSYNWKKLKVRPYGRQFPSLFWIKLRTSIQRKLWLSSEIVRDSDP